MYKIHRYRVDKYLEGEWKQAHDILLVVDRVIVEKMKAICQDEKLDMNVLNQDGLIGDGPSRALMEYMEKLNFEPPNNWSKQIGRKLESK